MHMRPAGPCSSTPCSSPCWWPPPRGSVVFPRWGVGQWLLARRWLLGQQWLLARQWPLAPSRLHLPQWARAPQWLLAPSRLHPPRWARAPPWAQVSAGAKGTAPSRRQGLRLSVNCRIAAAAKAANSPSLQRSPHCRPSSGASTRSASQSRVADLLSAKAAKMRAAQSARCVRNGRRRRLPRSQTLRQRHCRSTSARLRAARRSSSASGGATTWLARSAQSA